MTTKDSFMVMSSRNKIKVSTRIHDALGKKSKNEG